MTSAASSQPSSSKINRSSLTLLLIMLVAGVIGLAIFRWKEHAVFPSASIDLKIPKTEILGQAEQLAKELGYQKDKVIKSIAFEYDDEAKTFLEYELGNSVANDLMRETVPVFHWSCRFRKEFDQEKVDIDLSPTGKLTYFDFELPNDKELPSLNHDQAKQMALAFVREKTGWSEADLKLVEDETSTCPHRIDHSFTWENQRLDWKGAKLRGKGEISGNMLSTFNVFLHRPEEWDRKYSGIRSNNELLFSIAEIFYVLIYIVSLFIFFDALPKKNMRWKFALILAGFCALLFTADQFNSLPDALSEYSSQSSYSAFVVESVLNILKQVPFVFAIAMILGGSAEIVYRATFPNKIALEKLFTIRALTSWQMLEALIAGSAAFAISLGYQMCYYWLGERANYWCPLSVDNYQLLTATFPSLNAFSLGFFASGSEEILYRVLMFAIVQRMVGRFWLANLIQAAAWGFMHSNYPQQPAYARGVELTLEGMFNGWMLQRFGLLACFASHYLFDAFCTVLPLWSAPTFYQKLSAWLPLIPVPIVIAVSLFLRKKMGAPVDHTLSNEAIPIAENVTPKAKREVAPLIYMPLKKRWRYILLAFTIVAPLVMHFAKPTTQIYTHPKPLQVSREQAIANARAHLTDMHVDLTDYRVATAIGGGPSPADLQFQYIFEKAGFARANALAEAIEHSYKWRVRFFKPLVQQEYEVDLDETGKVISQTITKEENAPGAKLTQDEGKQIAEAFLKEHRAIYSPLKFDNARVENRKNRIDYILTFKVPQYKVADADFIVTEEVVGDMPSSVSHYWKIPDQWRWEREKRTKKDEICYPIEAILSAAILIATIWWVISLFRRHFVKWRVPCMVSSAAIVLLCLQTANLLPGYFNMYRTAMPIQSFIAVGVVTFLIGTAFSFAIIAFTIAVAWAGLQSDSHKDKIEATLRITWPFGDENSLRTRCDLFIDGLLLAAAYLVLLDLIGNVASVGKFYFGHSVQINAEYMNLNGMANSLWPSVNLLIQTIQSTLFIPLFLVVAFGLATKYRITTFWRYFVVTLVIFAVAGSSERYWQDYLIYLCSAIIAAVAFWFFLTRVIDRNVLSIVILVWMASLLPAIKTVYKCGLSLFPLELAVAVALILLPLIYAIYLLWRVRKKPLLSS